MTKITRIILVKKFHDQNYSSNFGQDQITPSAPKNPNSTPKLLE